MLSPFAWMCGIGAFLSLLRVPSDYASNTVLQSVFKKMRTAAVLVFLGKPVDRGTLPAPDNNRQRIAIATIYKTFGLDIREACIAEIELNQSLMAVTIERSPDRNGLCWKTAIGEADHEGAAWAQDARNLLEKRAWSLQILNSHADHRGADRCARHAQSRILVEVLHKAAGQPRIGCQLVAVHAVASDLPIIDV